MRNLLLSITLGVLSTPLAGPASAQAQTGTGATEGGKRPQNVRALAIRLGDLVESLELTGPLNPLRAATFSSEETGVVVHLPVRKGEFVGSDDPIVELDRGILAAQLAAAEANLNDAKSNESRAMKLLANRAASGDEYSEAQNLLARAVADAKIARIRHERAIIRAPYAGLLVDRKVELGELVHSGQTVARIVDPYTLILEAGVTEPQLAGLSPGASARIRVGQVEREAEVRWVGFEADPGTGKFPLEIEIPNSDLEFRAGIVARATVLLTRHEAVIVVPREAVIPGPSGPTVFRIENGRAHQTPVTLGPKQGNRVIVSEGLSPGDDLVVRGQRGLSDGDAVTVREEALAAEGPQDRDSGRGRVTPRPQGKSTP